MTTPTPPSPRTLHADDPSELLAEAHVCLGCVPRDCLVLIGHAHRRSSPLATRVALRDVRSSTGSVDLVDHLRQMRAAGCDGAFVLAIAGDGHQQVDEEEVESARMVALEVLRAAAIMGPGEFDVPEAWALAAGSADRFLLEPDGEDGFLLGMQGAVPLTPLRETLIAVQEVHAGRILPVEDPMRTDALRRLGDVLRAVDAGPDADADDDLRTDADAVREVTESEVTDLAEAWEAALSTLDPLLARVPATAAAEGGGAEGAGFMTECERLAALRRRLAAPRAVADLLARLIEGPDASSAWGVPALVLPLVKDPERRPASSIRAGGRWYRELESMRVVLEGTGSIPLLGESARAWSTVSAVLAVLAWWNHRFATAGDLAEEMLMRREDDPLAPFLLQLADAPVHPAWRPVEQ